MVTREFERHKLVMIVCTPGRGQWPVSNSVITAIAGQIIAARAVSFANGSASVEIETKLQAIGMKGASPVKGTRNTKIVPLDCDTNLVDVAIQGTPSVFQFAPCSLFRCATRIHLA